VAARRALGRTARIAVQKHEATPRDRPGAVPDDELCAGNVRQKECGERNERQLKPVPSLAAGWPMGDAATAGALRRGSDQSGGTGGQSSPRNPPPPQ
jgi:hypothetical protein